MRTSLYIPSLIIVLVITAFSCEHTKDFSICGVDTPLEDIIWLKYKVNDLAKDDNVDTASITSYEYLKSNAFYVYIHRKNQYDMPSPIYNCKGEIIFQVGGNQQNDTSYIFFNSASNPIILWSK